MPLFHAVSGICWSTGRSRSRRRSIHRRPMEAAGPWNWASRLRHWIRPRTPRWRAWRAVHNWGSRPRLRSWIGAFRTYGGRWGKGIRTEAWLRPPRFQSSAGQLGLFVQKDKCWTEFNRCKYEASRGASSLGRAKTNTWSGARDARRAGVCRHLTRGAPTGTSAFCGWATSSPTPPNGCNCSPWVGWCATSPIP